MSLEFKIFENSWFELQYRCNTEGKQEFALFFMVELMNIGEDNFSKIREEIGIFCNYDGPLNNDFDYGWNDGNKNAETKDARLASANYQEFQKTFKDSKTENFNWSDENWVSSLRNEMIEETIKWILVLTKIPLEKN